VRNERNLGIPFSTLFFSAGANLMHESAANPQSSTESYLFVGATLLAIGLIAGSWAIQRRLFLRRLEQHARENQ
jgi:ABC-type antimicrobial peptide transport system permease subunit